MIMMIAAALAAAPAAAPAAPADPHAQHQQQKQPKGQKHEGCCCCKDMAKADHKMECCAEHGEGHGGDHSKHGATR